MPAASPAAASRRFTIDRRLRAPRDLVFRAFVEPDRMKMWWAPRGFSLLSCQLDLREGGAWRMRIRADDTGAVETEIGTYREIRAPERLAFTHAWVRRDGTLTPPTLVTVDFLERDGGTEIRFTQAEFHSDRFCRAHEEGWTSSFSQLTESVVEGRQE